MKSSMPRRNSPAELQAYDRVCERLGGFDGRLSFEWIDGFLAAVAAGPRPAPPDEWLPALAGDAFDRAFADPDDRAQALHALQTRLKVLADQLDPEALLDAPDALRLDPLIGEWTDADRQALVDEDGVDAEDAAAHQTGAEWAMGFLDGIEALPALWTEPDEEQAAGVFGQALDHVAALLLPPGSAEWAQHLAQYWPKQPPTRDELLAEACAAVQDLRLFWVDFAPRPPTRRVQAQPGRNDPCPCGSGKKFKKCHGAAA
ncbi:MAG: UPF0149 family protein [Burkholderiales bacterium]|nr:UPF0149 family protein [Burkholderiales bacterium]